MVLLRAQLATFWRLALRAGWCLERHYMLYPNPWPKPGHLQRRWHGHPVFPDLLSLGGKIEMRCNWEVYAKEFAQAVHIATGEKVAVRSIQPEGGISAFEKKYLERGQQLFSVSVSADTTGAFRKVRLQGHPGI